MDRLAYFRKTDPPDVWNGMSFVRIACFWYLILWNKVVPLEPRIILFVFESIAT